jgi:hypothetical protein
MLLIIMIPTVLISLKTFHTSFLTTHFLQAFQEFTWTFVRQSGYVIAAPTERISSLSWTVATELNDCNYRILNMRISHLSSHSLFLELKFTD